MSTTEQATVTLNMGGKPYTLRPTLAAMKACSRYAGGYSSLFRLLSGFDLDAIAHVIAAGTGSTGKAAATIEDAVYQAGGEAVLTPVVRFARICFLGGRDPDAVAAAAKEGTRAAEAEPSAAS